MFVELHLIQNFSPACLNRDDTNAPKDCEFGGYRRARISSQCIKRAIRCAFKQNLLLPKDCLAHRTKLLVEEVTRRMATQGKDPAQARMVVQNVLRGAGLGLDDEGKTEYLLFLSEKEICALTELCLSHWEVLRNVTPISSKEKETSKEKKKAQKEALPPEVRKAVLDILERGKAADLALFGRMLADLPEKNIDAACQVAHAISTHKVNMEMDYYTAVDDLQPKAETGAGMMGTVEFNSACFYRYANIDLEQLKKNLQGDEDLAKKTVEAFLRAAVTAIPTGKQNSMAAQNPPSFIFAVVRKSGLWSLANAFLDPVRADASGSLVQKSTERLHDYWAKLVKVYGDSDILHTCAVALDENDIKDLPNAKTLDGLIAQVLEKIQFEPTQKEVTA